MAHLWMFEAEAWRAMPLAADRFDLGASAAGPAASTSGSPSSAEPQSALLIRSGADGSPTWALITAPEAGVRVNGEAPLAGLSALADRDEIRTKDGRRLYYSTETLAQVEPFPGAERPVYCGRCRQLVETGAPSVSCPGCAVRYHQTAELPCWTYADKCTFCEQATALDAGYRWSPEE